jgi:hypothetical protein
MLNCVASASADNKFVAVFTPLFPFKNRSPFSVRKIYGRSSPAFGLNYRTGLRGLVKKTKSKACRKDDIPVELIKFVASNAVLSDIDTLSVEAV